MENILIFGHKKPDTDSVTASIALSYLKNYLGYKTEARILGNPNNETKYALDYFKVKTPIYLNDIKLQIKDLNYLKNYSMDEYCSINQGFNYMNENLIGTLPITSKNKQFIGMVSMKDIAKTLISNENIVLNTSYENIINTIDAKEIIKFDDKIQGELIVASYRSTTFIDNINIKSNTILMVGDRHSIIEYAINKHAKMIILTGDAHIKEKHLQMAKENKINIIRTKNNTLQTSRKIELSNFLNTLMVKEEIIKFDENDDVNDFIDIANKSKYSNYPVTNNKNECLGLLRFSDIHKRKRKQVILVDHNEASQSVDGLEEAEILEIIDHHKIGTIGTSLPINFRNMPVGSSNTIIYMLYQENGVKIPPYIAGLMLSGIISDTLLFRSPTTTDIDKKTVEKLAKLANIDYKVYGMNMLKAGASLKGKTKEEILYTDFKNFTIQGKKIGIGQVITLNIEEINKEKEEYVSLINKIANNNDYYIIALFATDIINNGSYIYFNDQAADILDNSFKVKEIKQGQYLKGIVSRKKQMIPNIMDFLEKK